LEPDTQGTWFYWQDSTLFIHVYLQPKASHNQVVGVHADCLKIRLTDPPIEGRANLGLIAFLAAQFRVAKQKVTITAGEQSRKKWIRIDSPVDLSILSK
jgi:uncharacterized protein (TIGR00251 family)